MVNRSTCKHRLCLLSVSPMYVENICLQYVLMGFVFTVSEDLSQYFCPLSQNLPVFVFLPKCSGICISPQLSICYFVFDSLRRGWTCILQPSQSCICRRDHTLWLSWLHCNAICRQRTLCESIQCDPMQRMHCNISLFLCMLTYNK